MIPLAALAGVLFFVASRLMKVALLKEIWSANRIEFLFAAVSALGVIFIGVEQGFAIAVGLAMLGPDVALCAPTHGGPRASRRHDELGAAGDPSVSMVDDTLVVLFDNDLFFANAGVFRRDVHQMLATYPESTPPRSRRGGDGRH